MYSIGVVLLFAVLADAAYEGDTCVKNGAAGVCKLLRVCTPALNDIKNRKNPQSCGFSGMEPIVCCVEAGAAPATRPPATRPPATSTTMYVPPEEVYVPVGGGGGTCAPMDPLLTAPRNDRKAWNKCLDYQEELIYPCQKGVALTGELARGSHCGHSADELIVGGQNAARGEFPHMVLLGYGDTAEAAQWMCGGALISERYVLTAGHCSSTRDTGPITFLLVGAHTRNEELDPSRVYRVKRIIKHPNYKPPIKYNDIALVETENIIKLSASVVPACLHTGEPVRDERAQAVGWGALEYRGPNADVLQKVTLTKYSTSECQQKWPPSRQMKQGFDANTQLCYGDREKSKDTCQGDSGGPLQIKNTKINCMYTVIGITSFGKACGWIDEPGIYTKVAPFTPWIENIVWP